MCLRNIMSLFKVIHLKSCLFKSCACTSCFSYDIILRNLLSSASAVSMEFMSAMAMLPIPAGTGGNVTEFLGVVRRGRNSGIGCGGRWGLKFQT